MILHRADTLTLLRQDRPTFQRTMRGQFDTGTRRFKCLSTSVANYLRTTFVDGTSDLKILTFATGGTLGGKATMYLDSVGIEQEVGDCTILSAGYKGIIAPKAADVVPSVELRTLSEVPTGGYVTPVTFLSPVPSVTHSYVTDVRPSVLEVGSAKTPPQFGTAPANAGYYTAFRAAQTVLFVGWILKARVPLQCGGLFQCTDTFTYETVTAPEL